MAVITPQLEIIRAAVRADLFPKISVGVFNCRKTRLGGGRTGGWSQHAWGNAGDFFVPNPRQSPTSTWNIKMMERDELPFDAGDILADYLTRNRTSLKVSQILWRERSLFTGNAVSNHWNHLHVVAKPRRTGTPPCAQTGDDDVTVKELIKKIQKSLKAAGYYTGPIDGLWGANTQDASDRRDADAAKVKTLQNAITALDTEVDELNDAVGDLDGDELVHLGDEVLLEGLGNPNQIHLEVAVKKRPQ